MPKIRDIEDWLRAVGYSKRVAKDSAAKLQRRLDFREITALFAGDPTATVAALRAHGIPAPARYARAKLVVS